jgi:hypothetical protein
MTNQKELNQAMGSMNGGEQIEITLSKKYENKTLFIRCYNQSEKWGKSYSLMSYRKDSDAFRDESVNIDNVTSKSLHVYTLSIFGKIVMDRIPLKDITIVSVECKSTFYCI